MPRRSCAQTTIPFRASRGVLFVVVCLALALRSAAAPDLRIPPRAASKLTQGGGHVRLDITSPRSGERVLLRQSEDDAQDDALGGTVDDASNSAEPSLGAGGRRTEPSQTIPLALRLSHEPTGTLVTRTVCFVVAALQQGSMFNHTSCTDVVLEEGASDLNADGVGVAVEGEGWYHVRAEAWSVDKDGQRILLTSTSVSFAVTTGSPPATLTPASVLVAIVAPLNTYDVVDETRQHAAVEAEAEANIDTDADAEQGACRAEIDLLRAPTTATSSAPMRTRVAVRFAPILHRLHHITDAYRATGAPRLGTCLSVVLDRVQAYCVPLRMDDVARLTASWMVDWPEGTVGIDGALHTVQVQVAHDCAIVDPGQLANYSTGRDASEETRALSPLLPWSACSTDSRSGGSSSVPSAPSESSRSSGSATVVRVGGTALSTFLVVRRKFDTPSVSSPNSSTADRKCTRSGARLKEEDTVEMEPEADPPRGRVERQPLYNTAVVLSELDENNDDADDADWLQNDVFPYLAGIEGCLVDVVAVNARHMALNAAELPRLGDVGALGRISHRARRLSTVERAMAWRRVLIFVVHGERLDSATDDPDLLVLQRLRTALCGGDSGSTTARRINCVVVIIALGDGLRPMLHRALHRALDAAHLPDAIETLRVTTLATSLAPNTATAGGSDTRERRHHHRVSVQCGAIEAAVVAAWPMSRTAVASVIMPVLDCDRGQPDTRDQSDAPAAASTPKEDKDRTTRHAHTRLTAELHKIGFAPSLTRGHAQRHAQHARSSEVPGVRGSIRHRIRYLSKTAPPPLLVSLPIKEGLGNRLRALASAHVMAAELGRSFVLGWAPSVECPARFDDLFRATPHHRFWHFASTRSSGRSGGEGNGSGGGSLGAGHGANRSARTDAWGAPESHWHSRVLDFGMEPYDVRAPRLEAAKHYRIMFVRIFGAPRPLHIPCGAFMYRKSTFYKSLVPVAEIMHEVSRVERDQFKDRLVVGMHIRGYTISGSEQGRGTPRLGLDWPVVPLHPGTGPGKMSSWADVAPVELFEEFLTQWWLHSNQSTAGGEASERIPDHISVFVASNSDAAKAQLLHKFGGKLILTSAAPPGTREGTDNDNNGRHRVVRLALVDWLLLSRTAFIAGSYCSSFSHEASVVHLRERIQIRAGGHLMGESIHVAGCRASPDVEALALCTPFMDAWGIPSTVPVFC